MVKMTIPCSSVDIITATTTPTPTPTPIITPTPTPTPTPIITPTPPPMQAGFGTAGMLLIAGLAVGVLYIAIKKPSK